MVPYGPPWFTVTPRCSMLHPVASRNPRHLWSLLTVRSPCRAPRAVMWSPVAYMAPRAFPWAPVVCLVFWVSFYFVVSMGKRSKPTTTPPHPYPTPPLPPHPTHLPHPTRHLPPSQNQFIKLPINLKPTMGHQGFTYRSRFKVPKRATTWTRTGPQNDSNTAPNRPNTIKHRPHRPNNCQLDPNTSPTRSQHGPWPPRPLGTPAWGSVVSRVSGPQGGFTWAPGPR